MTSLASKLDFLPGRSDGITSLPLVTDLPFLDIAARFVHQPGTVLLASGGKKDCARYNILGIDPWLSVRASLTHATVESAGRTVTFEADPLEVLQHLAGHYRLPEGDYPYPLCAGLLGYLSYDLKDCIEVLPRTSVDDLHLPHLYMAASSIIVVEDRRKETISMHVSSTAGDPAERIDAFRKALNSPPPQFLPEPAASNAELKSCFTREEYMGSIKAIRDYIVRGHVYQVNMSQRFETSFQGNPFDLFSSLFKQNPASFFAYINADDHHIVSTSPERFIELRGRCVETRPIKGTRPRGKSPEEDLKNREDLIRSEKDDAELSMIVDLLRNDIGKVCSAGSVKVREHRRVEAYENVFHLVSIIDGLLDEDKDAVDLIRAAFPGGSITGCPKIRSMEIIDELEPVRRHLYTGSIGYIGFHDSTDLSIAIRTAIIKDDRLVFSVGGGVVYDSDPADEYEETLHKGETLMNAVCITSDKSEADPPVFWFNGKFLPKEKIKICADDEGFLYGHGIFETIRVQNGFPIRLAQHVDRFNRSWQYCFGTLPPDITWDAVISQVVDRCGLSDDVAAVKILAAAGKPGKPYTTTMLVTARQYTHRLKSAGKAGLHLAVYPHHRYSHLSSHKTMNYMFCKMANEWAKRQGADEAVIVNHDNSVCETATANILCIIDGKWCRPASEHVLPGTMEKAVCHLLESRGISLETRVITVEELKRADRVYITNALMGIVPIKCIDRVEIGEDANDWCEDINSCLFESYGSSLGTEQAMSIV
ncbi:MAG: aminodeoxychorismate synthase component I [Chitinispirillaceae bacterium]